MIRLFTNLEHALLEVRRDLAKAPDVPSSRVQQFIADGVTKELTNYSYGIVDLDESAVQLADLGAKYFPWWDQHKDAIIEWLERESHIRLHTNRVFSPAESQHPALMKTIEGQTWAYTYSQRLFGFQETIRELLRTFPDTRRAFWPIFNPLDTLRAIEPTRIPCTLGYQLMIRDSVPMSPPMLEFTIVQRSCDFEKFWLSDLWLGRQIQCKVAKALQATGMAVIPGNLNHMVLSLHRFQEGSEEIY